MPRPYDDLSPLEMPDFSVPQPPAVGGLRGLRAPRLETPFEALERMEREKREMEAAQARLARLRGEVPEEPAGGRGLRREVRGLRSAEEEPYLTPEAPSGLPVRQARQRPAALPTGIPNAAQSPAAAATTASALPDEEFAPAGIQRKETLSTEGAGNAVEAFGRGVERNAGEAVGGTVGLWAGAKGGAALGGAVGAMFGVVGAPVGAAIGGIAGGIAGMFGGGWVGKQTQRAVMGEEAWQRAEEQYQRDMAAHPLATLGGSLAPHAATFLVSPGGALKIGTKGVQAADAARAGSVAWMKAGRAGRVSEEALRLADSVEAAGKSVREAQRHIRMTRGAVEVLNRTGAARTDLGARVVESLSGRVLAYTTALEKEEAALKAARAAGAPIIGRVGQARVAKTARAAKYAYMGRAATGYGEDGEYNAYAPEVYSTTGDRLLTDAEVAWAASRKGGKGFINQLATERVTDPDKLLGSIPFLGSWHNAAKQRDIEERRRRLADPARSYGVDYYANPQYLRDRERVIADENARRIDAAREQSIRGIAGQIIGDMPAFMVEIANTPELGNLGAARGALAKVGGGMLQAAIQSNFQPGAVAAGYERNRGNEWTITEDEWGALRLAVERAGDSETKALWKGWAQNAVEYVSETMGEYMQAGVAAGGRRLMKATKPMPKKLGKFLADVFGDSPSVGKIRGAMRAGAVQPFFESLEERAGDFLKAAILADDRDEGEDYWQHLFASLNPGWKQWLAEQLAFLPLGGLQIAGAIGERRRREREDRGGGEGSAPSPTGTPPATGGGAPATGGAAPSAEGEISDEKLMALKNRLADFLRSHGAPEGTVSAVANAQEAADIHEAMNGMVVDAAMQALRPRLTEEQWGDLQGFRDPRQRLAQAARLVSRYSEMDNALLAASAALENEDAPDDLLARTADLLTSLKPEWREMADQAANPREALMEIAAQANAELADGTLDPADPRWKDVTARDLAARLQGAEAAAADARIADIATEALVGDLPAAARAEFDGLATPEEKAQWLDRRLRDPNAALNAVLSVGRHISRPDVDAPEAMFASVLDQLKGRFAGPWALSGGDSAAGTPRERLATLVAEIDKDEANRQFLETFARDPYAADSFDPSFVEMPSAVDDRLRPEGAGGMAAEDALAGEEAEEGTEAETAPAPEAQPAAQEAAESAPAPAPSNEPAPAEEVPQEPAAAPETPPAAEAKEVQPGEERYTREQLEALDMDTLRSMARATGLFPGGLSKTPLINILMRIQEEAVAWEPPETTEEQRAKSTVILSKWLHDGDTVMFADGSTGTVSKDGAFGPATIQTDRHGTLSIDEERSISALAVYRDGQEVTADLRNTTLGDSSDTDKERQARAKRIAKRLPGIKVAVVGDSSKGIPAKIAADFKANPDGKALFDEDTATIYLGAKSDFSSLPHEVFHAILHWSKTHARGLHGQLRTLMSSAPESAKEWARSHYAGREGATDDAILEEAAAELWGRTVAEDISAEERREADRLADCLASQEMTWWDKVRELCARILEKFVAHVPEKSRGRAADGTPVSLDDLKNLSPEQAARRLFDAIFNGTGIDWQGKEWKEGELPARQEQAAAPARPPKPSQPAPQPAPAAEKPAQNDPAARPATGPGSLKGLPREEQVRRAAQIVADEVNRKFRKYAEKSGKPLRPGDLHTAQLHMKSIEAMVNAIERKDADHFRHSLYNENTGSIKAFEALTGAKLPGGMKARFAAIDRLFGISEEERARREAEKAAKAKEESDREHHAGLVRQGERIAKATRYNYNGRVRTLEEIATDLLKQGYKVNRMKRGATSQTILDAPDGDRFFRMPGKTHEWLMDLQERIAAEKPVAAESAPQADKEQPAAPETLTENAEAAQKTDNLEPATETARPVDEFANRILDAIDTDARDGLIGVFADNRFGDGAYVANYAPGSLEEVERAADGIRKAFPDMEVSASDTGLLVKPKKETAAESRPQPAATGPYTREQLEAMDENALREIAESRRIETAFLNKNTLVLSILRDQELFADLNAAPESGNVETNQQGEENHADNTRGRRDEVPGGQDRQGAGTGGGGNLGSDQVRPPEAGAGTDEVRDGSLAPETPPSERADVGENAHGTGDGENRGGNAGAPLDLRGDDGAGEGRDNGRGGVPEPGAGVDVGAGNRNGGGGNRTGGPSGRAGEEGGGADEAGGVPEGAGRRSRNADNHVITDPDFLDAGGAKAKFRDNLAALRVLKTLREEGREATPAEREIIAKYVGWGRSEFRNGLFAWYGGEWQKEREELQELIGRDEFESARKSTLTAFWTPPRMAQAVWRALDRLGFKGGRVHEPSIGTGIFYGTMPTDIRDRSVLSGADKDVLATEIARALYPGAKITNGAYQEENLPDDFYDLVVGNFPFADFTIRRDKYNRVSANLHDYFWLKSLGIVRPGGLVAAITSTGTMDKSNDAVRREIADKADVVAAIRLPEGTFSGVAGTEVVTDLIILRKREPGTEMSADTKAWLETVPYTELDKDGKYLPGQVNQYYKLHPGNIVGTPVERTGRFGQTTTIKLGKGESAQDRLDAILAGLPENIYSPRTRKTEAPKTASAAELGVDASTLRDGSLVAKDGEIWENTPQGLIQVKAPQNQKRKAKFLIELRDTLNALRSAEINDRPDSEIAPLRKELNRRYDAFVKEYGPLSKQGMLGIMFNDPSSHMLLALERSYDKEKNKAVKADIFTTRVGYAKSRATHAENYEQAAGFSMNETGRLDPVRVGEMMGVDTDTAERELLGKGLAYRAPDGQLVGSDEYLSGNVREKLRQAEAAARVDPAFNSNVEALRKVLPADKGPGDITVNLGATWVPPDVMSAFASHVLGVPSGERGLAFEYNHALGRWTVSMPADKYSAGLIMRSTAWRDTYSTDHRSFTDILDAALHDQRIRITRRDPVTGITEHLAVESEDANTKADKLKDEFLAWVWQDKDRAARLTRIYNDTFNGFVERKKGGRWLTFPGIAPSIKPRAHQVAAVEKMLACRRLLMAHEVGTGKTITYGLMARKAKETGSASKPLLVVKNSTVKQVAAEIQGLFPDMNIFVGGESMTAARRKRSMAQIANNNWDLVILTHDNLGSLDSDPAVESKFIDGQISELIAAADAAAHSGMSKKEADRIRRNLLKRVESLNEKLRALLKAPKTDGVATFQDLGFDMVMVDECQAFKKLHLATYRSRVKGIPVEGSKRASSLLMNIENLVENNPEACVVFGSGTPLDNSLVEAYVWQRYLQNDLLKSAGITSFDAWASNFGRTTADIEMSPSGGDWNEVERFKEFVNLGELSSMMRQNMDVVFARDTGEIVRPTRHDSESVAPETEISKAVSEDLKARAKAIKERHGKPQKGEDNMLVICGDGRKAAVHPGLYKPEYVNAKGTKAEACIKRVAANHKADPKAAQMIFCDCGVNDTEWGFNLYRFLRDGLVKAGFKPSQVAFFSSNLSPKARADLAERMNRGEVLVAIGSTDTMGTGVNAQERLRWMHHLDASRMMTPGSIEQRNGRGHRQGNTYKDVEVVYYTQEHSLDAFTWNLIKNKAGFISAFMHGENLGTIEEESDTVSYDQLVASSSGDPRVLKKAQLEKQLHRLRLQEAAFEQSKKSQADDKRDSERQLKNLDGEIKSLQVAVEVAAGTTGKPFSAEVVGSGGTGRTFTERDAALSSALGTAVDAAATRLKDTEWRRASDRATVAKYRGFDIQVGWEQQLGSSGPRLRYYLEMPDGTRTAYYLSPNFGDDKKTQMLAVFRSADAIIGGLKRKLQGAVEDRANTERRIGELAAGLDRKFEHAEKITSLQRELQQLNDALSGKDKEKQKQEGDKVESPPESSARKFQRGATAGGIRWQAGGMLESIQYEMEDNGTEPSVDSLLDEWDNARAEGAPRKDWPLIPADQYRNALRRFMRDGDRFVFPERILRGWLRLCTKNLMEMSVITGMAGHDTWDATPEIEDHYNGDAADFDLDAFIDWARLPEGSTSVSDYGLAPIYKILDELDENATSGQMIVALNRILDVMHMNGDLSAAFIEGGSKTLSRISNDRTPLFQRGAPSAPARDWSSATIPELRKALVARGLSPVGSADVLRRRLSKAAQPSQESRESQVSHATPGAATRKRFAENPETAAWRIEAEPSAFAEMPAKVLPEVEPVCEGTGNGPVRNAIRALFRKWGTVTNDNTKEAVVFNPNDAGKMMMQGGVDMRRFAPHMRDLFKGAVLAWTEPPQTMKDHSDHWDVEEYRQYVAKFDGFEDTTHNIKGPAFVRFTVRVHKGGRHGVHAASVTDIEVLQNENAAPTVPANKLEGRDRVYLDPKLRLFLADVKPETLPKSSLHFQRGGAPAAPVPNPWDNAHVELQAKKKGHEWHVVAADGTDMGRFATQQSAEFAIAQERAVLGAAADSLGKLKKARLAEIAEARRKLVDAMRKADATKEERADAIAALGRALGLHKDLAAKEWALAEKILRTHDPESTEDAAERAERAVNTVLARASIKLHGRDMMRIVKQKAGGKVTGGLRRNALLPVRRAWDLMREQMTEEEKARRLDEMDRAIETEAAELQAGEGPELSRSELAERLGKLAEQMNERELFAVFGGLATIHGGANRARLAEDARAWADASATLASLSDRAASELKNKLIARAVQAKEIREQIIREMTGGRDIPASNQERQDAKNARGFGARARELVRGLVSASMGGGRNWGEVIVHDKSVSFGEGAASHLFHDGLAAGYKAEMEANEADREEGLRILSQHFAIDPNTDIHKLIDFSEKCETLFNDEAVDDRGRHEITVRTVHIRRGGKGKKPEAAVVAGGPCTLKLGELMHFYLIGLQAEAAAGQPYTNTPKRTKGADCSLMEALVQHGYAAETMAEIRAALQKRGLDRLALQISADMEKKGDDLDALMAKEYNSQLKRVHPYAPLRRLHWGLTEQGDADGGGVGSFMSMVRSFLKERVSNTRDFQTVNLIESWQSHNRQANHIIHLHDWISTVGRVMRHADMQTALDFVVGDRTRRALNAWLDVQARGGSMVIRDDGPLGILARNFAVAVTTNPRVALKQLTSPGMALGMLPEGASTWEWFKDMATIALPGEERRAFLAFLDGNSPEWRERGLNASDALSLINRHKAGDKWEILRLKVQRKLGAMTRWGDRNGALLGCYGVFKAWERRLLAQGMDPDAARIAALERFVDSVNAGQQSVLPEYMSQVQTMGGLYKYMSMFHTAQIAMARNLYTHAKAWSEGRGNRWGHARAIMGVVASAWAFRLMGEGLQSLFQILRGLFEGDPEKVRQGATRTMQEGILSVIEAPCSGVMPLGDAIVSLAEGAVKGGSGWGSTGNVDVIPQLSIFASVGRIVSDFRKSSDKRDWLAVSRHAADLIGQTTGIPVTPVIDVGSGIYDAKTADDLTPEQRAARALSFSRSAIGAPRRKPTPKQTLLAEDPWAIPAGQEWMYGLPQQPQSVGLRTTPSLRR